LAVNSALDSGNREQAMIVYEKYKEHLTPKMPFGISSITTTHHYLFSTTDFSILKMQWLMYMKLFVSSLMILKS